MMEDEHEVYGRDIFPEEGDLDGKPINESIKVDDDVVPDDAVSKEEPEEMKKRLKEMEEEAAALRDVQAKVEKEMGSAAVQGAEAVALANKEADARSVFVSNVDYSCTPEEVQQQFQSCRTVN